MAGTNSPSPKLAEFLAVHPFAVGMDESQLRCVTDCATALGNFATDQLIFQAGGVARVLYLIRSGDIALEVAAPGMGSRIVSTLHGGDVLGWSWLFPPYRWAYDARALSPTEAILIDGEKLRQCATTDHELGYHVVWRVAREMADRLQATRLQMLDVYGERR